LLEYFPNAKQSDWKLAVAGQRVQVIMPDKVKGGVLQFGTEVVSSADGSIVAVLGASPGASVAVAMMLDVIGRCFKSELPNWTHHLKEMIPSYGQSIADDADLCRRVRSDTAAALRLADAVLAPSDTPSAALG
jgi:malate dehydrogenase (quinone)